MRKCRIVKNLDNQKFYPEVFTDYFGYDDWLNFEDEKQGSGSIASFDTLKEAEDFCNKFIKHSQADKIESQKELN